MTKIFSLAAILLCAAVLMAQSTQKKGPRIFLSVDMEGIWGVVHGEQTSPGPEYAPARRWMAEDVNAVIDGLLKAGVTDIVVNDGHGSMRNIVPDAINPRASLVTGAPKPLTMMQGIDSSFDACIFVGYHSRAGSTPAILDHTISGGTIFAIKINGQELPELGINAAIAGYYKVPVIMLSGDSETCSQAKTILGADLVTAVVKEATGRQAARLLPAEEARNRLREAAYEAVQKKDKVAPFRLNAPFTFEVQFHNSAQSEMPMMLPQLKRLNARAVTFTSNDYIEGFKLLRAVIALAGSI
jgi:D-amino peptidase